MAKYSEKAGEKVEKAMHEMHATIIGFHYYPREWLRDNYQFACRLANECGYWYFPKFAMMPDTFRIRNNHNYLRITWENHGVAPAYYHYKLFAKWVNTHTGKTFTRELAGSDNRSWQPYEIVTEQYALNFDKTLEEGKYDLLITMRDECGFHNKSIQLGLTQERETEPGWYKLGEVVVK